MVTQTDSHINTHSWALKSTLLLLFILLTVLPIHGQVKFYAVVSEGRVSLDQTFQVQYVIEGAKKIERFTNSSFAEFELQEVFDIPAAARRNPFSRQVVEAYTKVAVLTPRKKGKFTIGGASAVIDGKLMKSNSVKVEVIATGGTVKGASQLSEVVDESEIKPGENIEQKIRENFFLTSEVNKTNCYVGEPLMAVYKACSRLNANSHVIKRPSLTGFSVVEMVDAYDGQASVETVRGKPFYVHLIRKVQLFPLQEGTYQLEGAEVESVIHFVKQNSVLGGTRNLDELMDRIKSPEPPTIIPYNITLTTRPLTITVKPLPLKGQPSNFSGAVGTFKMKAQLENETMIKGSQVRVFFTISGTGNFPLVTAPNITWPEGLNITEGGIEEKTSAYTYPLNGSKIFSFLLSADEAGSVAIPSAAFSYFNPTTEEYVQLRSEPMLLIFKEGSDRASEKITDSGKKGLSIPRQLLWFIPVVVVILGVITYLTFYSGKKKNRTAPKTNIVPEIKNVPNTLLAFATADFALAENNHKAFFEAIQQVLWKTAAEVCEVSPSGLNKQNVGNHFRAKAIPEDLIAQYKAILNECEWALYTPDVTTTDMIEMRQRVEELHKQLVSFIS